MPRRAIGKAFKISKRDAQGYGYAKPGKRMTPNAGVTAIAAVNGRGSYSARRAMRGLPRARRLGRARNATRGQMTATDRAAFAKRMREARAAARTHRPNRPKRRARRARKESPGGTPGATRRKKKMTRTRRKKSTKHAGLRRRPRKSRRAASRRTRRAGPKRKRSRRRKHTKNRAAPKRRKTRRTRKAAPKRTRKTRRSRSRRAAPKRARKTRRTHRKRRAGASKRRTHRRKKHTANRKHRRNRRRARRYDSNRRKHRKNRRHARRYDSNRRRHRKNRRHARRYDSNRRGKHRKNRRKHRKNRHGGKRHAFRKNAGVLDTLKMAAKVGFIALAGIAAHRVVTKLFSDLVLAKVIGKPAVAPPAVAGLEMLQPYQHMIASGVSAIAGSLLVNYTVKSPETKAYLIGGMWGSFFLGAFVDLLAKFGGSGGATVATYLSGYSDSTAAALGASIMPRYFPVSGMGEYFESGMNGLGEYFESGMSGLGNYGGNPDLYQAAAGFGAMPPMNVQHVDPSSDLDRELSLAEAAAGVGAAPYEAAAGMGGLGEYMGGGQRALPAANTWVPGMSRPDIWAPVTSVTQRQAATAQTPAGILQTGGGQGVFG